MAAPEATQVRTAVYYTLFPCCGESQTVVFTIPKIIRPFFRYNMSLLSDLCLSAVRAIAHYMKARADGDLMPGVVAVIQTFGWTYPSFVDTTGPRLEVRSNTSGLTPPMWL
jgi:hypothetical protein